MKYFNDTILNGIGQNELCSTLYIQEELVSVMSLCMVNNTATNKSCVSHQQVVRNFIHKLTDCNAHYPYGRTSITGESVFRMYIFFFFTDGGFIFFIMLQRRECALLSSLLKTMHYKILYFDHIVKYSNIYLQITN